VDYAQVMKGLRRYGQRERLSDRPPLQPEQRQEH
jgi:hypothetical protein